jgi:prevent-host-death family protein
VGALFDALIWWQAGEFVISGGFQDTPTLQLGLTEMKTVEASDAQMNFLQLLDEVERGETIVVTRQGKPIARLMSEEDCRREVARRAIAEIKEARKSAPRVTIEEILAWRDEGRK